MKPMNRFITENYLCSEESDRHTFLIYHRNNKLWGRERLWQVVIRTAAIFGIRSAFNSSSTCDFITNSTVKKNYRPLLDRWIFLFYSRTACNIYTKTLNYTSSQTSSFFFFRPISLVSPSTFPILQSHHIFLDRHAQSPSQLRDTVMLVLRTKMMSYLNILKSVGNI